MAYLLFNPGVNWLNSLGAATVWEMILRLLVHKLDLTRDCKFVKFRF